MHSIHIHDRDIHRALPVACSGNDAGMTQAVLADRTYTVSPQKHVTTFSTITLTISVRLQQFLA